MTAVPEPGVDVAVVGAGVAGLQLALTLGRARRSVALFDDRRPRNARAPVVSGFLAVPDETPFGLLERGRAMLAPYDVRQVGATVDTVSGSLRDGFVVSADGREFRSRRIVLAGGVADELPRIPGLAEQWGTGVVACPHCHGWEVRDLPLAQVGFGDDPEQVCERAALLSCWSDQVVVFPDRDDLPPDLLDRMERARVRVQLGAIDEVTARRPGALGIRTDRGAFGDFAAVFSAVRQEAASTLAADLGCDVTSTVRARGIVVTGHGGRTSVPGVWAAGSCAAPPLLAIGSAGDASVVATQLHSDLLDEDLAARAGAVDRLGDG